MIKSLFELLVVILASGRVIIHVLAFIWIQFS